MTRRAAPLARARRAAARAGLVACLITLAGCAIDYTVSTSASAGGTGCDAGQELCDGACVSIESDLDNCGECGRSCDGDQLCVAGRCREASVAPCAQCPCSECGSDVCCAGLVDGAIFCVNDESCDSA